MTQPFFPEFKAIGLEDLGFIKDKIERCPPEASEVSFANTFIWRNFDHPRWTLVNDNLCLFFEPPSEPPYFLQPIGDTRTRETIESCLTCAPRLARIPESFVAAFGKDFRCEPDRNNFDYVYLTEELTNLKGKRFDGKRNRIKKFEKNHRWEYRRISSDCLSDCGKLLDEWIKAKAPQNGSMCGEQKAILEALANFEVLGFRGCAIEVQGQIGAFSIGEKLNPDTAVIHVEIVNPAYEGLAQLINREFVRNEWSNCRFINREQDLGLPGLRRAKASYYPDHMVKKFDLRR